MCFLIASRNYWIWFVYFDFSSVFCLICFVSSGFGSLSGDSQSLNLAISAAIFLRKINSKN